MSANFYVISKGRASNVPKVAQLFPNHKLIWVIPPDEEEQYQTAGATETVTVVGLSRARNAAISHAAAAGKWCFQLDDDVKSAKILQPGAKSSPITVEQAAETMIQRANSLEYVNDRFFGVAPTDNAFYGTMKPRRNVFIIASFSLYKPGFCLYDTTIPLKEDYDFTCQVFAANEGVVRFDDLLISIQHYTNAGGAVADRNVEKEQLSIARLKAKWPGWFSDNPKRPNEVLLKLPKIRYETI